MKTLKKYALIVLFSSPMTLLSISAEAQDVYAGASAGMFGWKVYGGYEFTSQLAVEASYIHLDDVLSGLFDTGDRTYHAINGSVVGHFTIDAQSTFFGKLGVVSGHTEQNGTRLTSDSGFSYGVGYQRKFSSSKNWAFRVELEHFEDVGGLLSGGLLFRF